MESKFFYKGMSKIYDLLDILYFRSDDRSPRNAICNFIESKDLKVLDICTGTATNPIYIANHKKETKIIGIDISKEMLRIARKKVKKSGSKNIELYKMDATATKFKDKTFDVVLISLVLHEITNELAEKVILEAKRVLKDNGKILVVEWEEPQSIFQKMLFYPIKKLEPKGFDTFLNLNLEHYFLDYELEIKKIKHCDFTKALYLTNLVSTKINVKQVK